MKITEHFELEEFIVSDTAARCGINNDPPIVVMPALARTAQGMEAVRDELGGLPITITSGYRSLELNRLLRSKDTSQHVRGEACDFICPGFGDPHAVAEKLSASTIDYDQLIVEFGRWVHISFSDMPRRQALVIDDTGTRPMEA
jgi:zinc D-Ala-D-Ala carboxypeptidase